MESGPGVGRPDSAAAIRAPVSGRGVGRAGERGPVRGGGSMSLGSAFCTLCAKGKRKI